MASGDGSGRAQAILEVHAKYHLQARTKRADPAGLGPATGQGEKAWRLAGVTEWQGGGRWGGGRAAGGLS